jgi:periplasmic divalent cation tolerance protein
MAGSEYLLVFVTAADAEFGRVLGRTLVEEGLAACVQVIPGGMAIYRWEGQTQVDAMTQLIVKTRAAKWPALMERIAGLHSDDVPEILAVPVQAGLPAYLRWMDEAAPVTP